MESIMDLVTGAFRGSTLEALSAQLNESPTALERGIKHAVPLSMAAFAEQTKSERSASDLLGRIQNDSYPHIDPGELGNVVSDPAATQRVVQSSSGFMSGFFGDKLGTLVDMVTGPSGLSRSSAGTLFGLVSPMVLGWIGNKVRTKGLDAQGLSRLLGDEAQKVSAELPRGFSSTFGTGAGMSAGAPLRVEHGAREAVYQPRGTAEDMPRGARSGLPWLMATLLGLGVVFLWWAFRGPAESEPQVRAPETEVIGPEAVERQPVAGTDLTVLRLDARPLVSFFEDEQAEVPQRFLFEGLEFGTGTASIVPNPMLDEVARAITAHPSARLRIEGHTDHQGSDEINQALSQRRADTVKSYLSSKGVPANQLTAVGRGTRDPIADNATPEGRARNRRVELIITQR